MAALLAPSNGGRDIDIEAQNFLPDALREFLGHHAVIDSATQVVGASRLPITPSKSSLMSRFPCATGFTILHIWNAQPVIQGGCGLSDSLGVPVRPGIHRVIYQRPALLMSRWKNLAIGAWLREPGKSCRGNPGAQQLQCVTSSDHDKLLSRISLRRDVVDQSIDLAVRQRLAKRGHQRAAEFHAYFYIFAARFQIAKRHFVALEKLVKAGTGFLRLRPVDVVAHHAVLAVDRLPDLQVVLLPGKGAARRPRNCRGQAHNEHPPRHHHASPLLSIRSAPWRCL